jgi:hypothetical protein
MPAVHHGAILPLWILASPKDRMAKPVSSDQIDLAFGATFDFRGAELCAIILGRLIEDSKAKADSTTTPCITLAAESQ